MPTNAPKAHNVIARQSSIYSPFPLYGSQYSPEWFTITLRTNFGRSKAMRITADQTARIEAILYESDATE